MFDIRTPGFSLILFLLIVLIGMLQNVALAFSWSSAAPWIDIPMHIVGGFWLGLLLIWGCLSQGKPIAFYFVFLMSAVSAGWEAFEVCMHVLADKNAADAFVANFYRALPKHYVDLDTIGDFVCNWIGAGIALVAMREPKKKAP